jgi:hypothetical protein
MNYTALVVGLGEVGTAIQAIFHCDGIGKGQLAPLKQYDILHICFPFSDEFLTQVEDYQKLYSPHYTIIHSSVAVGTCQKLNAISSPIRGIHPYLEQGIRTFPKLLAGRDASQVADYFRRVGLKVVLYDEPETAEAAKLFDTEYYRHCIEFAHEVKQYCDKHELNFTEVYTLPNISYNQSYTELGHPEFVRPVLQPIMTEIGGHCVKNNEKILKETA